MPKVPVVADWPFAVTSSWSTDVRQGLFVLLVRGASCGRSFKEGLALDPDGFMVVGGEEVAGSSSRVDEVTLTTVGEYLVCSYLQSQSDSAALADAVTRSPSRLVITTYR